MWLLAHPPRPGQGSEGIGKRDDGRQRRRGIENHANLLIRRRRIGR